MKAATTDPKQIEDWWRRWPDANLGVAAGNGLVVLDIDGPEGQAALRGRSLPPTWIAISGRDGGEHRYFNAPAGVILRNRSHGLPDIDIKTDGGYVVAPPSLHATGRRYAWAPFLSPGDLRIADAPGWLLEYALADGEEQELGDVPSIGELDFSLNRPSPDRLPEALGHEGFRKHYERRACKGDPSACDLGLARWCLWAGWSLQETVDVIIDARRKHRDRPRPWHRDKSFWTNTLRKALEAARQRPVSIPLRLLGEVSSEALRLWAIITQRPDSNRLTQKDLGQLCGVAARSVRNHQKELQAAGALEVTRGGNGAPSAYRPVQGGPCVTVPASVLYDTQITSTAFAVYVALAHKTKGSAVAVFQGAIADACSVSPSTAQRGIKALSALGYVRTIRAGVRCPNRYALTSSRAAMDDVPIGYSHTSCRCPNTSS